MSDEGVRTLSAPRDAEEDLRAEETEENEIDNDASVKLSWPFNDDTYDILPYDTEFGKLFAEGEFYMPCSERGVLLDECSERFPFFPYYPQEEEDEGESSMADRRPRSITEEDSEAPRDSRTIEDPHRRSLFVHSFPSNFPDVSLARKSVFGSIFLRTTGQETEDATLLRAMADSSYSMLHSLLNSYERVAASVWSDPERKEMAMAYRTSLLRALETHGISSVHSDGSLHWNFYPINRDYLFSVQMGSHIHQTRLLSKIEERIISGSMQKSRLPFAWPTDSVWTGQWDALGMAGIGTYIMPHGVSYNGRMQNGRFHDDNATLTYPNKFKALHCVFVRGKLISCQFQFPDLLMHEKENWGYCKSPDRRFWSEVRNGLKPAKIAQKTEIDPPRKIPQGCYDTSDGFFNPKSLMLVSPEGELLRVPVCSEESWIKKYCRKGFSETAEFRPDLYENWFNYDHDLIQAILKAQANYRAGKMTEEELKQYYANLNLLPSWDKFVRQKSPSEMAMQYWLNSVPEPKSLRPPRKIRKYEGHKVPSYVKAVLENEELGQGQGQERRMSKIKSFLRFHNNPKQKGAESAANIAGKFSRISFKFTDRDSLQKASEEDTSYMKRKIPRKYLKYQPILKPPFEPKVAPIASKIKKCERKTNSIVSTPSWNFSEEEHVGEMSPTFRLSSERRSLRKFMKGIIMEKVTEILIEERERHRKRYMWGKKISNKTSYRGTSTEERIKILEELFDSIPDREEYTDSYPDRTCDLKKLAEDKYQMLKYWGKRIYMLKFEERNEVS